MFNNFLNGLCSGFVITLCVICLIRICFSLKTKIDNKRFKKSLRWWSSSSGVIEFEMPIDLAFTAYHSGSCDADVLALSQNDFVKDFTSSWNPDIVSNVLSEYGAWDNDELKDAERNIQRLLWLACTDLAEQEEDARG